VERSTLELVSVDYVISINIDSSVSALSSKADIVAIIALL